MVFHVADVPAGAESDGEPYLSIWDRRAHSGNLDQITMGLLFFALAGAHGADRPGKTDAYHHMMLLDVLRYIESHYASASLTESRRRLNQPVSQLSRMVKTGTGMTFQDLLQQQRLTRAEFLLLHSDLSVSDIICAVGYSNTSYFTGFSGRNSG